MANVIGDEPERKFFAEVPTVWDDTRIICGDIGKFAVIARRRGRRWFVGCMNAGEPRQLKVPLTFLDPQIPYVAEIYRDDPSMETRTRVRIDQRHVTARDVLSVDVSAQGGQAMLIEPQDGN